MAHGPVAVYRWCAGCLVLPLAANGVDLWDWLTPKFGPKSGGLHLLGSTENAGDLSSIRPL